VDVEVRTLFGRSEHPSQLATRNAIFDVQPNGSCEILHEVHPLLHVVLGRLPLSLHVLARDFVGMPVCPLVSPAAIGGKLASLALEHFSSSFWLSAESTAGDFLLFFFGERRYRDEGVVGKHREINDALELIRESTVKWKVNMVKLKLTS